MRVVSPLDVYLLAEGTHARLWQRLGAHPNASGSGCSFAVWAPNARSVSVIGDFNDWGHGERGGTVMGRDAGGLWTAESPEARVGHRYKYRVEGSDGRVVDKADPFAFAAEVPPATASVVADLRHGWQDETWMKRRAEHQRPSAPMSIYEMHLGSWRRAPESPDLFLGYRELAPLVVEHVRKTGFTHVELLPVMEHPFYGSWGYQVTGFFAPTVRYGPPADFMYFVDLLHQNGIGVILDWPPAHFPFDAHGLSQFDGTCLYEHADPRQGRHPHWGSAIFNYGRDEVRSFLISCAAFWLDVYHADALRVDAVASMLYLDYGRGPGEWVPNRYGGRENVEAITFLQGLSEAVHRDSPTTPLIAEESTAWPKVTHPPAQGGLGFDLKWDMGFMHDALAYFAEDPIHRRHHHEKLTFRPLYADSESFVLPLSHDEVVHGKRSLLEKMPGDDWQKFANLRLLYAYMWAVPGKKLLFMGGEIAQRREWNHDGALQWELLDGDRRHGQIALLVGQLNRLYREEPALHDLDHGPGGFQWAVPGDAENGICAFFRSGHHGSRVLAVLNCTPVPRFNYRVGVDREGLWSELLNTDAEAFGGSGHGNVGSVTATPVPAQGRKFSLNLTLPPLGALYLKEPAPGATARSA
jgi:1,4-alpha-glucan branching enzyme